MNEYIYSILRENVTTFEDKHELEALTESDAVEVQQQMASNMLKGVGGKKVDFGSIPKSNGRLEKFEGYENMQRSFDFISALSSNQKIDEVRIVNEAMANIFSLGDVFNKGFKLENKFVQLTYNTVVYACMDVISFLITCVDITGQELSLNVKGRKDHDKCLRSLSRFNDECNANRMRPALESALGSGRNNFVGGVAGVAAVLAIAASIMPIIRECIYLFFTMRIRVSDYLSQQAKFLEVESLTVEQSAMSIDKRNKIASAQRKKADELRRLSDKLSVEYAIADKRSSDEINKENKGWSLNNVRNSAASNDQGTGFQLI